MFKWIFLILSIFLFLSCCSFQDKKYEKLFIKQYDLVKLDGQLCNNCIVEVQEGYVYKIFMNGQQIGEGKWVIEHNLDFPIYILKLENGPNYIINENDTVIEYIDRRKN